MQQLFCDHLTIGILNDEQVKVNFVKYSIICGSIISCIIITAIFNYDASFFKKTWIVSTGNQYQYQRLNSKAALNKIPFEYLKITKNKSVYLNLKQKYKDDIIIFNEIQNLLNQFLNKRKLNKITAK